MIDDNGNNNILLAVVRMIGMPKIEIKIKKENSPKWWAINLQDIFDQYIIHIVCMMQNLKFFFSILFGLSLRGKVQKELFHFGRNVDLGHKN